MVDRCSSCHDTVNAKFICRFLTRSSHEAEASDLSNVLIHCESEMRHPWMDQTPAVTELSGFTLFPSFVARLVAPVPPVWNFSLEPCSRKTQHNGANWQKTKQYFRKLKIIQTGKSGYLLLLSFVVKQQLLWTQIHQWRKCDNLQQVHTEKAKHTLLFCLLILWNWVAQEWQIVGTPLFWFVVFFCFFVCVYC